MGTTFQGKYPLAKVGTPHLGLATRRPEYLSSLCRRFQIIVAVVDDDAIKHQNVVMLHQCVDGELDAEERRRVLNCKGRMISSCNDKDCHPFTFVSMSFTLVLTPSHFFTLSQNLLCIRIHDTCKLLFQLFNFLKSMLHSNPLLSIATFCSFTVVCNTFVVISCSFTTACCSATIVSSFISLSLLGEPVAKQQIIVITKNFNILFPCN